LRGQDGLTGTTGSKGERGATGLTGGKGDRGDTGRDGPRGPKGDSIVGPQGERGPAGDTTALAAKVAELTATVQGLLDMNTHAASYIAWLRERALKRANT
jgi:hypothetical protein